MDRGKNDERFILYWDFSASLFFIFVLSIWMTVNKIADDWIRTCRSLVLEATTLPSVQQTLPLKVAVKSELKF